MSVFARWLGLLFVVCLAAVSSTYAFARRDAPPGVMRLLPNDDRWGPGWAGLRPGDLPGATLQAWLESPPDGWIVERTDLATTFSGVIDHWLVEPQTGAPFVLGVVRLHDPLADAIQLLPADLTLGEVVAALGAPDYIVFNLGPDRAGTPTLQYRAVFYKGYLIAAGLIPVDASHLAVDTPVEALTYQARPIVRSALALDWRGFGPMARYYPQGVTP